MILAFQHGSKHRMRVVHRLDCTSRQPSQAPVQLRSLIAITGSALTQHYRTHRAKIVQVEGHDFVEVEGLARLINASVRFGGNQIVITLPGGADTPPAPRPGLTASRRPLSKRTRSGGRASGMACRFEERDHGQLCDFGKLGFPHAG